MTDPNEQPTDESPLTGGPIAADGAAFSLAMFLQAKDARQYGAVLMDGTVLPSWEAIGPAGQTSYLNDAALILAAVELLGYRTSGTDIEGGPRAQ